ncbi:MAG: hypothetical protein WCQ57_00005, partial [Verrucomicrobiota bacterium]
MFFRAIPGNSRGIFFGEAFFRSLSVGLRYASASSEAAEKRSSLPESPTLFRLLSSFEPSLSSFAPAPT